jgi:hypothetical protein
MIVRIKVFAFQTLRVPVTKAGQQLIAQQSAALVIVEVMVFATARLANVHVLKV